MEKVEDFVLPKHFNPHGKGEGAAICAPPGATLPESLASIANRIEWTVSMIIEVYLGFEDPGYQYLGRLLAGLLPNEALFATLPPHFTCGKENQYISEANNLCF